MDLGQQTSEDTDVYLTVKEKICLDLTIDHSSTYSIGQLRYGTNILFTNGVGYKSKINLGEPYNTVWEREMTIKNNVAKFLENLLK